MYLPSVDLLSTTKSLPNQLNRKSSDHLLRVVYQCRTIHLFREQRSAELNGSLQQFVNASGSRRRASVIWAANGAKLLSESEYVWPAGLRRIDLDACRKVGIRQAIYFTEEKV